MKNQTWFQNVIKANRKALLDAGYKPARLTMWAYGQRHPNYETAKKIAIILDVPIEKIPWVRWQKNL